MFCVIGDIHGNVKALEFVIRHLNNQYEKPLNVILTGDIGLNVLRRQTSPQRKRNLSTWAKSVRAVLDLLSEHNVYFTHGNHDILMGLFPRRRGHHYLHKSYVEVGDYFLLGWGGTKQEFGWPGEWNDSEENLVKELTEFLDTVPTKKKRIFVAHSPILGILDRTKTGEYVGSKLFRDHVLGKVDYFVHGHIHESWGAIKEENTWVGNAGAFQKPHPNIGYMVLDESGIRYVDLNNYYVSSTTVIISSSTPLA